MLYKSQSDCVTVLSQTNKPTSAAFPFTQNKIQIISRAHVTLLNTLSLSSLVSSTPAKDAPAFASAVFSDHKALFLHSCVTSSFLLFRFEFKYHLLSKVILLPPHKTATHQSLSHLDPTLFFIIFFHATNISWHRYCPWY